MAYPARHNVPLLICSLRATQVSMNANIGAARPWHAFSMLHPRQTSLGGWRDAGTVLPVVGTGAVLAIHPRKERPAIASQSLKVNGGMG
jgi:hypothetical protein